MALCGLRLKDTSHTVLGIEFLDSPPTLQWTGPSPSPFCRSWSSRRKSSLYSLPLAPWPCIMAKNVPSVVMPFFWRGGFAVEFMKGHKVGGIGFLEWRSAHWHHLRGENPLIPLCWFVRVWKLRRMTSLPSFPVSNFPALETPCFLGWDLLHCSKGQRWGVFQFVFVLWICQMLV